MRETTTHYLVRRPNGAIQVLFRIGPGGWERYNGGAGDWIADGYLIRYSGAGGDADDVQEIPDRDVPDLMAQVDAIYLAAVGKPRWPGDAGLPPPTRTDDTERARIEAALRRVEAARVTPDGLASPEEPPPTPGRMPASTRPPG